MKIRYKIYLVFGLLIISLSLLQQFFVMQIKKKDFYFQESLRWQKHALSIEQLDNLMAKYIDGILDYILLQKNKYLNEINFLEKNIIFKVEKNIALSKDFSKYEKDNAFLIKNLFLQSMNLTKKITSGVQKKNITEATLIYEKQLEPLLADKLRNIISKRVSEELQEQKKIEKKANETYHQALNTIYLMALWVLVLSGASLFLLVYNMYQNIIALQKGTQIIAKGNLNHKIDINSKDEFKELAISFNEMSEQLLKSKELLEEKVHDRTLELEKALQYLKDTQNQLLHMEKLAAIGKVAAGLAHEINTPLTSIAGYSEALLKHIEKGINNSSINEHQQYLNIIKEQAFYCKQIVQTLLDYARPIKTTYNMEIDLNNILQESIIPLNLNINKKNLKVVWDLKQNIIIESYPDTLKQVFLNIIRNAVESSFENREIVISSEVINNSALVCIKDYGYGIDEENLPKIFDPFFTTKSSQEGTGLGLAIAENIIKSYKGTISVESKKNQGTTFKIYLPLKI